MIRINLLPVKKRKKKAKPLPSFIVPLISITSLTLIILAYFFFHYSSNLNSARAQFKSNDQKIAELKNKIREVENFEKVNKDYEEKNKLIEQLRKNQNLPVMMLDEISRNLPNGVWISSMTVSGSNIAIDGYAFTNSDVVAYVTNLKGSSSFSDITLQESRLTEIEKITLYQFRLTFRMVA